STFLLAFLPLSAALPALTMQTSEDDRIYDQVRLRLVRDPDVKGGALEVEVKDGVVTVKGAVKKESARLKVEKLAKKVKGVKSVVNQVEVKQFP
ncbi:MAG TPA: BON domain-containing protein, partial [Bryobacteraceae bacterium]|nr:BON domain-containing protein [Bryobacteraceae bacterium]